MGVLSTFTYTGAASMANGPTCIAHGLPTTPDWAVFVPVGAIAANALSLPVQLTSRGTVGVMGRNPNGAGLNAELVAQFVHSIQR